MGAGVGARRMGMDMDMGRDHGTRGKGVSMGMGKMCMSTDVNMRVRTWSLANSGNPVTSLPRMDREILHGGAPQMYVRSGMHCGVSMTERGMPVPIGATHRVATIAGACWGLRVKAQAPGT